MEQSHSLDATAGVTITTAPAGLLGSIEIDGTAEEWVLLAPPCLLEIDPVPVGDDAALVIVAESLADPELIDAVEVFVIVPASLADKESLVSLIFHQPYQ
ncbi:hypothetical protein NEOLI_001466 [Neolecta irregularis DAH-3]|uniref:Uncharacterized protein n=1 Tax=Neolecta irregularis (strain DAH-3) TaxID=1198029 RepID=A0A1U7LG64_NEOID|nr:hypothetical protein NEOLI_001466 [Neolecta irregularis DAH-3]|eukprot:OLL21645.1 hypothetical protein NEOLI_001466 [Neolecta irregularis DAH-3]